MADGKVIETLPEDWGSALAIVAHPDDLEYGASSAVAKWTAQGKKIGYVMVTRGEAGIDSIPPDEAGKLREIEQINSARVVGVKSVQFLNHTDGVVEYGMDLRRDISAAIRKHRPNILITGNFHIAWNEGNFNMADHRAVGLAVLDAARDAGNRWIFPELLEEGLEPTNSVEMVFVSGSPNITHAVDVGDFIDKGVLSLEEHKIYIENLGVDFDPDFFLRMNANAVGRRFGCDYAVGFEVFSI